MAERGESEYYALNQEQRERLLASCETLEELACVKFPMYLGYRISETLHFNATWIAPDSTISIPRRQECTCRACAIRGFWKPKTKAGVRIVYTTADIWGTCREFLEMYPGGFLSLKEDRQSLYYTTKKLLLRAEIKIIGAADGVAFPHALRATCATWLAENDMNAAEICNFMGWTNLGIAQRYINNAIAAKNTARKLIHATK